ncbi:MAG: argininosuccinate lyase [Planctomycetes bacterium]|nr:argininosuccinate lyase [Planctomycetota bacterium]NOG56057.1 argininosuccinate lyase [Planctomycetota bacterium]
MAHNRHLIWDKGSSSVDERIQQFLAGEDIRLDAVLLSYDIKASIAHVHGLARIGILTAAESDRLGQALDDLEARRASGDFVLDDRFEDGHSAIESDLIEHLGDLGKKVHTGRSRNDQIQVALRLYMKEALAGMTGPVSDAAGACLDLAEREQMTPMPGYTHLQRAVPSSVGLWMAAYAEAFIDNLHLLKMTARWIDTCPLGTAAGFGVNLPLDRDAVSEELGFARLQVNPMYAQNSRGSHEIQVLSALGQVMLTIRRLAWDLSLFTTSEFNFITLPDTMTTGSSIMPNKRNPDVVELLRTPCGVVWAALMEIQNVLALPAGYHRDLQATKPPLVRGITAALQAAAIIPDLVGNLTLDRQRMADAIDQSMYQTDRAVEAARSGIPFRDAYRSAAAATAGGEAATDSRTPAQSLEARMSPGACADLRLDVLRQRLGAPC